MINFVRSLHSFYEGKDVMNIVISDLCNIIIMHACDIHVISGTYLDNQ